MTDESGRNSVNRKAKSSGGENGTLIACDLQATGVIV
jgi:hypothetical protein